MPHIFIAYRVTKFFILSISELHMSLKKVHVNFLFGLKDELTWSLMENCRKKMIYWLRPREILNIHALVS